MQTFPSWNPLWPLGSSPHPLCTTPWPPGEFSQDLAAPTEMPQGSAVCRLPLPLPCDLTFQPPFLLPPTGACQGLPCSPPTSLFLCGFSTNIISHKTIWRYGWFIRVLHSFFCPAEWFSYAYISSSSVLFHCGLSQDVEYGSLCCMLGPCCPSSCRGQFASAHCKLTIHPSHMPPPNLVKHRSALYVWVCSVL